MSPVTGEDSGTTIPESSRQIAFQLKQLTSLSSGLTSPFYHETAITFTHPNFLLQQSYSPLAYKF